ncbi:EAL domain-containing protein [Methylobacterium sp. J-092]|uniref:sensor domain-containing phosphodiesterase n=1 Tax=Methylobacterium sp. J-092 TaxID=2836667 RepID=UPI001FBB36B9|nr:EAL domain-containing protein [Methylobacterium sp. J-092]MCJ2009371.1 EAL domain-containing protein [Methylobacterium sp. J-092]
MPLAALIPVGAGGVGEQVQSILRAVRRHLAMDVGFVSEFVAGDRVFRYIDGEDSRIRTGGGDPLGTSFCHYVARGLVPGLLPDAAEHPVTVGLTATHAFPIGAHLSVPLRDRDGTVYGTLCCFSYRPGHGLTSHDLGVLRFCGEIIEAVLHRSREDNVSARQCRVRIADVIERQAFDIVYQPIYRTADSRLVAFEALARFALEPHRPPNAWFAEAAGVGLGEDLELLAISKALVALDVLDPAINLTINLSPEHVTSPHLPQALARYPLERVVLELTENAVIEEYEPLRKALAPLRQRGLRLAIDDVGAGHSSFRHVVDLAPEFIKLDKSLIRDIDVCTSRRALAAAITAYSCDIGCEVIAEGVETAAEYAMLCELGTTRVQGYLMGRPMPLAEASRAAMEWFVAEPRRYDQTAAEACGAP